jgi:recyclin-1
MDRFDANMLAAFDRADSRGDEEGMREAAWASWIVWEGAERGEDSSHVSTLTSSTSIVAGSLYGGLGAARTEWGGLGLGDTGPEWELGKVWAEKREIFYESGRWDALENFKGDGT